MSEPRPTRFDLLLQAGFGAGCLIGVALAWRAGVYIALAICALLALLAAWALADGLRRGVRPATPFERFEQRLLVRVIAIVFGGGLALALGWRLVAADALPWSPAVVSAISLLAIAGWLIAALVAVTRLRGKHEALAAYQRRVKYRGPLDPEREPGAPGE